MLLAAFCSFKNWLYKSFLKLDTDGFFLILILIKAQHTIPFSDRLSPATVKIRLSSPAHDQQQLLTVGQLETLQ